MPDTAENQAMSPQPPNQQSGLGFPLARIAVLLSLATGACHDLAIAPYAGKGTPMAVLSIYAESTVVIFQALKRSR